MDIIAKDDAFKPPSETLPPMKELEAIAEIDDAAVSNAIDQWKANPPDAEFKLILEATDDAETN
ncbi:MAG: hypothetical protein KME42_14170 [Tildeniella nuda ZEHNDER 1965/U140]|jgi:hypothetical protein|nr:hypothetical protein [Tildeniella nuda ZEHNDER 1965/U140]